MRKMSTRLAFLVVSTFLIVLPFVPMTAEAQRAPQAKQTTKATAARQRPRTQSVYVRKLTPRKSAQNTEKRSARKEAGRSATGDTRRQGQRLNGAPQFMTSWRAWNRATAASGPGRASGTRQTREAPSGQKVHFRTGGGRRS